MSSLEAANHKEPINANAAAAGGDDSAVGCVSGGGVREYRG
jgi:hypothetical protein